MLLTSKVARSVAATLVILLLGTASVQANPVATITIQNNWTSQANYSATLSSCAATLNMPFTNIPSGLNIVRTATSTQPNVFGCTIYYSAQSGSRSCR